MRVSSFAAREGLVEARRVKSDWGKVGITNTEVCPMNAQKAERGDPSEMGDVRREQ